MTKQDSEVPNSKVDSSSKFQYRPIESKFKWAIRLSRIEAILAEDDSITRRVDRWGERATSN